jgi:predicted transcriptional regulator
MAVGCPHCATEPLSAEAHFCRKCGAALTSRPHKVVRAFRLLVLPFALVGRVLWYPVRLRQERIRWLTEASGPASPINEVHGLSDGAKRVYSYLASVTLRFGSSHSKVTTIARVTHISENRARAGIRELERRGFLSHKRRNTWHGRGAHAYFVRPVKS